MGPCQIWPEGTDCVFPLLQTREALSHAQAAGCPIILALTKCDMPGADPARVKSQLLSAGLLLEEAGGTVLVRLCCLT